MMKNLIYKGWRPVIAILVFIGLWEFATHYFSIEDWLLPAPSAIINEAQEVLPTFLPHFLATLKLSSTGFMIGTTIGLVVATLLHVMPRPRETVYPFLIVSQNIPFLYF